MPVRILLPCLCLLFIGMQACQKESLSLKVFREVGSPVADDLTSVWMTDSLHGSITGGRAWERGVILSTSDGGNTWQTDTLLNRKMECIMFDNDGQGYACGQDGIYFKSPGSSHWESFRINYFWNRACHFPDSSHGVMTGGGGFQGGQISTFGSDAFWKLDTLLELPNALAGVCFSDAVTVHAVGLGWIMRSDNAGRHWQRLEHTGDFFQDVQFPTPDVGYICGSSGTILKTANGGQSWQTVRKGGSTGKRNRPFRSLWFTSPDEGYIAGDGGLLWYTGNGGADWLPVEEAPADADFTGIFVLGNKGWAVAKKGRVFCLER